jgi:hypothetical protein
MKPIISKNLTEGRGVSKPLSASGRGLQEGLIYTLKTFKTSSKRMNHEGTKKRRKREEENASFERFG